MGPYLEMDSAWITSSFVPPPPCVALFAGLLLAVTHDPERGRRALPIRLRVVHLFSAQRQHGEFSRGNGLGYIGQMIPTGWQILGIEAHRLVAQLFVVKTPAR